MVFPTMPMHLLTELPIHPNNSLTHSLTYPSQLWRAHRPQKAVSGGGDDDGDDSGGGDGDGDGSGGDGDGGGNKTHHTYLNQLRKTNAISKTSHPLGRPAKATSPRSPKKRKSSKPGSTTDTKRNVH